MIRPNIRAMSGYVPGEQPRSGSVVKLNTNESPYPPSPRVVQAIQETLNSERLRKYPDPLATDFRQAAAKLHGIHPEQILVGNGSDDLLTIITRTVVPEGGLIVSPTPSYILYRSLSDIQGGRYASVPFEEGWSLPSTWPVSVANLTFVANPNSPSGTVVSPDRLSRLADEISGSLVIDEAYVDFADDNCLSILTKPNVIITRTFSKSYGLAGLRVGYAMASRDIISEMEKVKDSYNCDVLSLAGALAAIQDQDYLKQTVGRIRATRDRLSANLIKLGFDVTPSHANFVWCRKKDRPLKPIYEELKSNGILIRYMTYAGYGDGLRISVGSDSEIDQLLQRLTTIVKR